MNTETGEGGGKLTIGYHLGHTFFCHRLCRNNVIQTFSCVEPGNLQVRGIEIPKANA